MGNNEIPPYTATMVRCTDCNMNITREGARHMCEAKRLRLVSPAIPAVPVPLTPFQEREKVRDEALAQVLANGAEADLSRESMVVLIRWLNQKCIENGVY